MKTENELKNKSENKSEAFILINYILNKLIKLNRKKFKFELFNSEENKIYKCGYSQALSDVKNEITKATSGIYIDTSDPSNSN